MEEVKRCEARVLPLTERRARLCGRPAVREVGGKLRCLRHLTIARRHYKEEV